MRDDGLAELLERQSGGVARRQLLALGLRPHDVKRLLRRRSLARVHPGVFVEHTGPLTGRQRAWAAVLALWPAALCAESALDEYAAGAALIHVAVARDRRPVAPPGVRVHRISRFDQRVQWNRSPPRIRYEDAVLEVADRADSEFAAFEVLAEACRSRRTTPCRLAETLAGRARLHRRAWLSAVLADLADGSVSVLEQRYQRAVERAHRLPRAQRQVRARASVGIVYRDAEYPCGLLVELDGRRAQHGGAAGRRLRAGPGRRGGRAGHSAALLGAGRRPAVRHGGEAGIAAAPARLDRRPTAVPARLPGRQRAACVVDPGHREPDPPH